jgi:hypothetical protein
MVAMNITNLDETIDLATSTTMRYYKHAVRWATVPIPGVGPTTQFSVAYLICRTVVESFGFINVNPGLVEKIIQNILWENGKRAALMVLGETLSTIGIALTAAAFTAPIGAVVGVLQCLASVPATASAILMCACDVILILERAFYRGQKRIGQQDIELAAMDYQHNSAESVHNEATELAGMIGKVWSAFQYVRIRLGVERIIGRHRVGAKKPGSEGSGY